MPPHMHGMTRVVSLITDDVASVQQYGIGYWCGSVVLPSLSPSS